MPPTATSRIAEEIADSLATGDAARVAHQLGGIVANDEQVRRAIESAMGQAPDPAGVLVALAAVLTK
jgi:hypothetical protein